jgi:hypothetical protein
MISAFPEDAVPPATEALCKVCEARTTMAAMKKHRLAKGLPEGHILAGGVNLPKRTVYVVDPANPGEEPTGYTFAEVGFTGCEL